MSTFFIYLKLGLRHILDLHTVDHMLIIIALVAMYQFRDWKRALFLIFFYLLGHSLSMSFAVFNLYTPNQDVIQYLVPLTIFIAAASNIFRNHTSIVSRNPSKYIFSGLFGAIQGFSIAGYFSSIVSANRNLVFPHIAFNVGIFLGILIVLIVYLVISWIFVNNLGVSRRDWYLIISSAIAGIALTFMFESRYWLE